MCKCTPEIRTPFCGRGDCLPPASREPTESLFAANAEAAAQASLDRVWAQAIRQSQLATSEQPTKLTAQELLAELAALRTQLEQALERETALREALEGRQAAAHLYGLAWANAIDRIPSHNEPIETCPSPGCKEARRVLSGEPEAKR